MAAVAIAALEGGNENPPVASPGTGLATVTVDTIANTMAVNVNFAGLIGNVTAAHIHCCMDAPGNAGVASPVPSFPGFPLGVTARGSPGTAEVTMSGPLVGFIFDF